MLSDEAQRRRQNKVTATAARNIMNAQTDAEMLQVFDRFIGALEPEPENYAMRAGSAMEPVIVNEYQLQTGEPLTRCQEFVDHPNIKDFGCTLDGWRDSERAVVEIKFCSPFMSRDEIFRFYFPQVSFQMLCTEAAGGYLVVGQGTADPWEVECIRDADYETALLERCTAFLKCVRTMTPPVARPLIIPPERWRTIDISVDQPNWGPSLQAALVEYDETAEPAKAHEVWGKTARELIPDDVGKVIAGEFILSRNKKGVLSIRRAA